MHDRIHPTQQDEALCRALAEKPANIPTTTADRRAAAEAHAVVASLYLQAYEAEIAGDQAAAERLADAARTAAEYADRFTGSTTALRGA